MHHCFVLKPYFGWPRLYVDWLTPAWWHRRRSDTSLLHLQTCTVGERATSRVDVHVEHTSTWMKLTLGPPCCGWNEFQFHQKLDTNAKRVKTSMAGAPHSQGLNFSRVSWSSKHIIPFIGISSGLSMSASWTIRSDTSESIHQNWCGDMEFLQYHYPLG